MLRATQTGYTLVNGFSGYYPPHYDVLREGLAERDPAVLTPMQRAGSLLVFVHSEHDPGDRYRDLIAGIPGAHQVMRSGDGTLYELPARAANAAAHGSGWPLSIASISASASDVDAPLMLDGDLVSRWSTFRPQAAGDQVRITLEHASRVGRVELDLSDASRDYPRRLRIEVIDDNGSPSTVWEDRGAGVALVSALTDPQRLPLAFDLAPTVPGREIVLTNLEADETWFWSIAEVRVFGEPGS
jgi:hypothetical protein